MLQARFGYRDEAQRTLEDALAEEPGSAMTRVNLANLALLTDDLTRARRILEPVYNAMPESVVINALLASIERRLGNDSKAARHADLVISRDPELARRYSIGGEWSETRASGASGRLPPIWATGPGDI
jgi:predicted Zn-dependent protease